MDLSKMKGLLETNGDDNDDNDLSENDLMDEINAILSGQSVGVKVKQSPNPALNVKRVKQNEPKATKTQMPSKINKKSNQSEINISDDLLNIENLGIIEDFDDDNEDIDENDEDLLSEINAIASKPSAERVGKQNAYKTPPIDYEFASNSRTNSGFNDRNTDNKSISPSVERQQISPKEIPQKYSDPTPTLVPNLPKPNQNIPFNQITESTPNVSTLIKTTDNKSEIPRLNALKDDYKRAALSAKKSGQQAIAISHIKTAKQIEVLVKAIEDGLPVDLSQLPPPPSIQMSSSADSNSNAESLPSSQMNTNPNLGIEVELPDIELTTEDAKKFFNAPPPPNSVMEALEQRLAKFKSTLEQANQENNASKVRRLNRIVKQYENTIKDVKRGKTVDFDELPTPPGFAPIPVPNAAKPETSQPNPEAIKSPPKPKIEAKPPENIGIATNKSPQIPAKPPNAAMDTTPPKTGQRPPLKRASSSANKQLNYLLERQRMFKEAALESKQKGDIQQAKEYLRMAKGFEPLIDATQNGLPIDATSIPTPPQMSEDFVIVSNPDTSEPEDLEKEEMFRKIEVELQNQIEMCKRNKEYFLQLGDISTSSKFEKYVSDTQKDLSLLVIRWKNGQKLPNVKHETRTFSVVICNPEVATNEVSIEVIKAIDIPAKPDVDTYVRLEFPFPNDNHQTNRTKTVKNSLNPVFDQTFKFDIDRKSRQLPRIFKRHPLKLELMSKGGFLRSDSLIGTVLIKLVDFENKCTIHESFPLSEGRKVIGGRIEAKVRIREPLLSKQVEEVKEKWLTFV